MGKRIDLIGERFGRLTVIEKGGYLYGNRRAWLCACECGETKVIYGASLRQGKTRSCGCLKDEVSGALIGAASRTHGEGHNKTIEYNSWVSMRQRCLNPNNPAYKDYGGRGIKICDRWNKYENFLADMGRKPDSSYSIERVENNKGYSPENCKWATMEEQCNNRRSNTLITFNGKTATLAMWSKESGTPVERIIKRISTGWNIKDALFKPVRKMTKGQHKP